MLVRKLPLLFLIAHLGLMLLYLLIPSHASTGEQGASTACSSCSCSFGHLFHGEADSRARVEHLVRVSIRKQLLLLFGAEEEPTVGRAGQRLTTYLLLREHLLLLPDSQCLLGQLRREFVLAALPVCHDLRC